LTDPPLYFRLFNEIGIIDQLATALFHARLPPGLLVSHFAVVNHLARGRDGASPQDMARAFQVPKATMSHTLSVLCRHGLVELRPHHRDGRMKTAWLTEAGRRFRGEAIAALTPDMDRVATAFGRDWAEETVRRLEALRIWLDEDRNEAARAERTAAAKA
jgi:DNA-binding MarR family transcriptional regulator